MLKPRLLAPGPVEVPPEVLAALARPVIHHRTDAFAELFLRAAGRLAEVACVPGEEVLILTASGTAAFEAGLLATVPRGERLLCLHAGKFGERWLSLARAYGYEVEELSAPWGEVVTPGAVRAALEAALSRGRAFAAVLTVHSETSTGALFDVQAIAREVRDLSPETLLLVDCVTSLSVTELRPRDWGLDGVFSGSQKGVMMPPGLAFAWLSARAWERGGPSTGPSFYLDLHRERARQRIGQTATTPAVNLIYALDAALALLLVEGVEPVWARRERLNGAVLAGASALGCRPFASRPSPAVAALTAPDGIGAPDIVAAYAARGVRIGGGQDQAKRTLFRPSVLGYADAYDALTLVAVLEEVLRARGREVPYGHGVAAAMRTLEEGAHPPRPPRMAESP